MKKKRLCYLIFCTLVGMACFSCGGKDAAQDTGGECQKTIRDENKSENMTKEDFIKKFPDIKVQQFETETILSKQEIMDIVEQATQSMDMGLVYYEHCGCNITVFTSDKMKAELAKMVPGYQVTDPNTGETGTIVSEKYIVCGNYCVRVEFPSGTDVYDCDFFIE